MEQKQIQKFNENMWIHIYPHSQFLGISTYIHIVNYPHISTEIYEEKPYPHISTEKKITLLLLYSLLSTYIHISTYKFNLSKFLKKLNYPHISNR